MSTTPKMTKEEALEEMLSGFQNDLPAALKNITLNGKILTPAQVEAQIQGLLPTFAAVDTAHLAYTKAVANRYAVEPQVNALLAGLRQLVKQLFPGDVATQAKFGVTTKARAKPSALTVAASVEKAKVTREKNKPAAPAPSASITLYDANGNPLNAPTSSTASASASPANSGSAVSVKS